MIEKKDFLEAYNSFSGYKKLSEMIANDFFEHQDFEVAKKQHFWLKQRFPNDFGDFFIRNLLKLNYHEEALFELNKILNNTYIKTGQLIKYLIIIRNGLKRNVVSSNHIYKLNFENETIPLTNFGEENKQEIFKILDNILDTDFPNGFFEEFCELDSFGKLKSKQKNSFIYNYYEIKGQLNYKISYACSNLLREAENRFRLKIGGKKIGEGSISETDLYYKIKNYFNDLKVLQHGKPKFLGRQHFDIWIPDIKVAIEYQGEQHYTPIEVFGGEEGYKKNLERDEQKRIKCLENGIKLFEVTPDYILENLINLIEIEINSKNKKAIRNIN